MIFETLGQLAHGLELRTHQALLEEEPEKQRGGWLKRLFKT
jgi:hypothetical protein